MRAILEVLETAEQGNLRSALLDYQEYVNLIGSWEVSNLDEIKELIWDLEKNLVYKFT